MVVINSNVMCRRRPLGRLAELYSRLLHGADLSPSDEFISLILLSAAQRKSRQAHVRNAIKLYKQQTPIAQQHTDKAGIGHEGGIGRAPPPPPSHDPSRHPSQSGQHTAPRSTLHHESESEVDSQADADYPGQHSNQGGAVHPSELDRSESDLGEEMQDTLSTIHTPSAVEDTQGPAQSQRQSPDAQQDRESHVIDMPAEGHDPLPPQCSASSVHGDSPAGGKSQTAGKVKRRSQPASSKKVDVQDLEDMEEGGKGTDAQTEQKRSGVDSTQAQHSRTSSRRSLNQDEFFERDFMLAPSSFASEYDPDIAPDKLADIYTGQSVEDLRPFVCL